MPESPPDRVGVVRGESRPFPADAGSRVYRAAMLLELLREGALTAAIATMLLFLACISIGSAGVLLTFSRSQPERAVLALRLSRALSLAGGSGAVLAVLLAVPYDYLAGRVTGQTAVITELLVGLVAGVWCVIAAAVMVRAARETHRR